MYASGPVLALFAIRVLCPGTGSSMMDACREVQRPVTMSSWLISGMLTLTLSAVMLMETFNRLSRKEKYVWDVRDMVIALL